MSTFEYLEQGENVVEQALELNQYRRILLMNPSAYHAGTVVANGGYAISDDNEDAPGIGPRESIKHRSGSSSVMRCATQLDVALIGFSPRYYISEYDDPADPTKKVTLITNSYVRDLPTKGRCRSAISMFVALKADRSRQLWELSLRGFNTEEGTRCINQARNLARKLADLLNRKSVPTFAMWLPLGVGDMRMVGSVEKSPIVPPQWKVADGDDLQARIVDGDDFATFIELRRELDEFLATGRYSGQQVQQLPALAGAPAMALPEPSTDGVVTF